MDLSNVQVTKDCIQQAYHIGKTVHYNICNGNISEVPWGSIDWMLSIMVGLAIIIFTLVIIKTFYDIN
jgi:hypothetical protein